MKKLTIAAVAAAATATPALAHHPLAGAPMETFSHGLLSGVGHPVLGFDHLFFVILMGIAALFTGQKLMAPAAYIGTMLVGCLMISLGATLPFTETVVALSLLVLGGIVLLGRGMNLTGAVALFGVFGLFHGAAFGGTIAGQEASMGPQVLIGYLIGLGVIQYAIAVASGWVAEKLLGISEAGAVNARLAGAVVAGIGLFLTLEAAESAVLSAVTGA